jgi:hypothetical protein
MKAKVFIKKCLKSNAIVFTTRPKHGGTISFGVLQGSALHHASAPYCALLTRLLLPRKVAPVVRK